MTAPTDLTGTWTVDPTHSSLGFMVRHAMVTKVRGRFTDFEGQTVFDGADLTASTSTVTIRAASIDTGNADRDNHLRANDFFDMDTYPEITFVSTSVTQTGDGVEITGDLTVKGQTKQITIPFEFEGIAKDPFGNLRAGFEGHTTIDRNDFGLTFNAALETGGVLVSDKVTLDIEISAIKQA